MSLLCHYHLGCVRQKVPSYFVKKYSLFAMKYFSNSLKQEGNGPIDL